MRNIDYANDFALTADKTTNATVVLHYLQNADSGVSLYANVSQTEFIGFKQEGSIQTVSIIKDYPIFKELRGSKKFSNLFTGHGPFYVELIW